MRVVLLSPSYTKTQRGNMFGSLRLLEGKHPPLGLASVAAAAERAGHHAEIIDAEALGLGLAEAVEAVLAARPGVVGIGATTPTFSIARAHARAIRESVAVPLVVGGPQVTVFPEQTLEHAEFDVGVVGEGEETFVELLAALGEGADLSLTRGLVLRGAAGRVLRTEPRPYVADLDGLAPPAWHLLPMGVYGYPLARKRRYSTFIASRGCPFQCVFCDPAGRLGRRFRFHSPEYVVEQLTRLRRDYGVREIAFYDDTFTAKPEHTMEVCERMIGQGLDLAWECRTRVNVVTQELLRAMRRAGCYRIRYGVESGDDAVLKAIKKGITRAEAKAAFSWTREAGIETIAYFMIGLPGDDLETVDRTIGFAVELRPNYALFSITCFGSSGSELFQWGVENDLIAADFWDSYLRGEVGDGLVYCARDEFDEPTLRALQKRAYRAFYGRPHTVAQAARNFLHAPAQSLLAGAMFAADVARSRRSLA